MFDRFTDKSIKVMMMGQEEARRLKHNFVGTEQILLGLMAEGTGIAAKALKLSGLNLRAVRTEVENIIGKGSGHIDIEIPFTPRAKSVLEHAWDAATAVGADMIDTQHILLGLLQEQDCVAVKIINTLKIDTQRLLDDLQRLSTQTTPLPSKRAVPTSQAPKVSQTPTLDAFGVDLTDRAAVGFIDPVIGRAKELERVIQILGRRSKNNPILLGEPGVGKTAIAEGLALAIVNEQVPEFLAKKRVVTLEVASLVAGTKYRGEFEERLKKVVAEVISQGNVILIVDEIHTLIGAGASEGSVDAANILKPGLARSELQIIGATTYAEYRKHFERDAALARRFQPVDVPEPSINEAIEILKGLSPRYAEHHGLTFTEEAVVAAVKFSQRYIADRFLPDKAIDLLDEAGSRVRFQRGKGGQVTENDIAEVLAAWTGIPVQKMTESETERLIGLESVLHERVVGQHEAIKAISRSIRRARVGLKSPKRPVGSFVFCGPTGVGKTELAKTLAEYFYGTEDSLIRIDMSEYMEKHAVARMTGSPPGYIGHEDGGQLTELVRRRPHSVILFDEVEKAHPDVFNVMLQILEDGHLTDSKGRKVDFKNTIIILTSNVGARNITKGTSIGFSNGDKGVAYTGIKDRVLEEMKTTFRPEFLNRLDEIVVFHPLSKPEIRQIVDIMLDEIYTRMREMEYDLLISDDLKDKLGEVGYSPTYGARPLRRAVQAEIEDQLAEEILRGKLVKGVLIVASLDENKRVIFTQQLPTIA
jgi:ATP-dependent Clp protease ATP-binding subunit ClpC